MGELIDDIKSVDPSRRQRRRRNGNAHPLPCNIEEKEGGDGDTGDDGGGKRRSSTPTTAAFAVLGSSVGGGGDRPRSHRIRVGEMGRRRRALRPLPGHLLFFRVKFPTRN